MKQNTYADFSCGFTDANTLIRTVKELGIPLDQDEKNLLADAVGRSSVGTLNAAMTKDSNTMLHTLTAVWHPLEVISFFNNWNPAEVERKAREAELRKDNQHLRERNTSLAESLEKANMGLDQAAAKADAADTEAQRFKEESSKLRGELILLKARMYDLMTASNE